MDELTVGERKAFETQLTQHNDEDLFSAKCNVVVDPKKNKAEPRIILVGKHRVYVFKAGGKLDNEAHLADIQEIASTSPTQLAIKTKGFTIVLQDPSADLVETLLSKLYLSFAITFPGKLSSLPLIVTPEDRLKKIKEIDDEDVLEQACGGYINSYQAICDLLGIPVCQDISWDINNLYVMNDVTEFNLFEIGMRQEKLTPADLKALLCALEDNKWFTSIVIENMKLDKEIVGFLSLVFERNNTLESAVIKEAGVSRDNIISLSTSFSQNPALSIVKLDLSGNQMEDKGMIAFASCIANFKKGLQYLNVSQCGAGTKGTVALIKALESNEKVCSTMNTLILSGNKLEIDGSKALGGFLSKATDLKELGIGNSGAEYHLLKKGDTLLSLDISGNKIITKDSKHLELFRFLQLCPKLEKLNISHTNFPPELFSGLLQAQPHIEHLDASDNNIGDNGLLNLSEALKGTNIKKLHLDRNFEKATKLRGKALHAFTVFLGSDGCKLESLSLVGNTKSQLKTDLLPFIFSLMTNKNLKSLDITGNQIGPALGLGLGKALQTNKALEELYWDDNGVTVGGYLNFKVGLARNSTLKVMPLPVSDISNCMKDPSKASMLSDIVKDIQQLIFRNCTAAQPKPSPPPTTTAAAPAKVSAAPQHQPAAASQAAHPVLPTKRSGPPMKPPPATPQHQQQQQEQLIQPKKLHPSRLKPQGIDAQHASALFGQLNQFLSQAAEELTPEEIAQMKLQVQKKDS